MSDKRSPERESGPYWVLTMGVWIVATWVQSQNAWKIPGQYLEMMDEQMDEIDERKIERLP